MRGLLNDRFLRGPFVNNFTLCMHQLLRPKFKTLWHRTFSHGVTQPRIAIVGAGPAGLVLARLLQTKGVQCTVFELDKDQYARTQGGTLDLHEGSAQRALKEAGLFERFLEHARPEGETLRIYDPNDHPLLDESKDSTHGRPEDMHGRPEIDRVLLRGILLDSLHHGSVKWAHKLLQVTRNGSQTFDLHFENGSTEEYDLVVGADGTWSKVRRVVTEQEPFFSGITGIDVTVSDPESKYPDLGERVGKGMCLTLGENKGILAQRNGDGAIRIYALMRAPESWHQECGIDWSQTEVAKKIFVERHFNDWSLTAKDLILKSDDQVTPRPIYMLPIGLRWTSVPGVALTGDAAHVMSPFAGVGVNVAMEDALELALEIAKRNTKEDLPAAIESYEKLMFARAEEYAKQSWMFLNLFFNKRGGAAMMEHFEHVRSQEQAAKANNDSSAK